EGSSSVGGGGGATGKGADFRGFSRPAASAALLGLVALLLLGARLPAWSEEAAAAAPAKPEAAAAPAKPDTSACNHATFHAVIDVGHTVEAPAALSHRGVYEYDFNLRLSKLIEKRLLDAGFEKTTLLITSGKSRRGLFERAARANKMHADLFLAIHHDSVPDRFVEKWQDGD